MISFWPIYKKSVFKNTFGFKANSMVLLLGSHTNPTLNWVYLTHLPVKMLMFTFLTEGTKCSEIILFALDFNLLKAFVLCVTIIPIYNIYFYLSFNDLQYDEALKSFTTAISLIFFRFNFAKHLILNILDLNSKYFSIQARFSS